MDSENAMKDWNKKISTLLSKQLSYEYKAFYLYTASSSYFGQLGIELRGLKRLYKKMAMEELEHADGIIGYMNKRGYKIEFYSVDSIEMVFEGVNDILQRSLELEVLVLKNLNKIYKEADSASDYPTTTFLDAYLDEQVSSIKELHGYISDAERCGDRLGEFLFDRTFRRRKRKN